MVVVTPLAKVVVIGVVIPVDSVRTPFALDMTVGDADFLVFPFPCSELAQGKADAGALEGQFGAIQDAASTAWRTTTVSNTEFEGV